MKPKKAPQNSKKQKFSGLTALVTGSNSGIGLAIAQEFLTNGYDVILTGRSPFDADAVLTGELKDLDSRRYTHVQADVSDENDRRRLADQAWNWRGRLDILVNCAGADILTGKTKKLSFEEKLRLLWSVDVLGTVGLCRELGKKMKEQGTGCIINIGWDGARRGLAGDSSELFSLAKGAVESFSLSLAQTLAPEVRVNVIAPGWIQTKWGTGAPAQWQEKIRRQTLSSRWGTPEEIASVAAFLASPAAGYVNGQIIDVNGGFAVK
ncbi:MAG: SDR family oxidoreductase [Thermoguttaceae bacterium]|nr:SDR family oxidoreductase [Thermoguttaceae bacterium]MBQ6616252.1 SDR family oxidoreductase [Thermoguttaceae bacterium]